MAKRRTYRGRSLPGRLLKPAAWLLAICALAAGGWLGTRAAWSGLVGRPEFRLDALTLALDDCPPWVRPLPMARQLRGALSGEPHGRSLLDADVAHIVAGRLRQSPWVLQVATVQRRLPNSLLAGLVFRKPAGIVWMDGKRYLVDRDGHWLPDDLFKQPAEWDRVHVPVIEDRRFARLPTWGRPWNGPRYAVGARMTEFLHQVGLLARPWVSVIDVTGVGRSVAEPDIALIIPWVRDDGTPAEARVRWGKSSVYTGLDGLEQPLLVTPDGEKARMLLSQLAEHPGLKEITRLDLRFPGQIFSREAE